MMNEAAIDLMFENMDRATADLITRIQEADFVQKFLPILASKAENVDLRPWLEVCKHFQLPVDVYRGNEFLFRVPALNKTIFTNAKRARVEDSINEISNTAALKGKQHARLGDGYLIAALTSQLQVLKDKEDITQVQEWNAILTRYGYEPLLSDIAVASPIEGGVAPTLTAEDETYEDI